MKEKTDDIDILEEKEKKAIEYIKNCLDNEYNFKNATRQKDKKAYNIILNLIEKQSKEIEKLKENKGYHLGFIDGGIAKRYEYQDKIKAKIEELKETADEDNKDDFIRIEALQSLLGKE